MWWLPWTLARADEPTLPVLVTQPPIAYPERALELAREGDVLLRITIDEQGLVAGVELVEGAGHGFDAIAVEGAYSLIFEPAKDSRGDAVPAVIEFRTQFRMADVAPLAIEGRVGSRNEKKSYAGVRVRATAPDGERTVRTVTDDRGVFRFAGLESGRWLLTLDSPALLPTTSAVDVVDDGIVDGVRLTAEERPDYVEGDPLVDEFVEVVGSVEVEPAERVIDHDTVVNLPGSFGDPVRALQNLPGVARAPFGSGQLLVRGNEAADTGYYLDGMRIPLAFHFSAVSTVVAADLLKQVEMIPGGYGVRYGNAVGGIVDLTTTTDLPKKGHTSASADVFQANVFTHQRMGKNTSIVMSARRSYADVLLQPVLAELDAAALRVPRYYDAQIHLVQRLARDDRFTATFYLSEDRFRLIGTEGTDAVTYRTGFQKAQIRWITDRGRWRNEAAASAGPEIQQISLSGEQADLGAFGLPLNLFGNKAGELREEAPFRIAFREEGLLVPADSWFGVRIGADGTLGKQRVLYTLAEDPELAEDPITSIGLYGEPTLRFGPLDLIPGVRANTLRVQVEPWKVAIDPRVRSVLEVGRFEFVGSFGWYSQAPAFRELAESGSPSPVPGPLPPGIRGLLDDRPTGLTFERSTTASLGGRYLLSELGELGVTVYRQTLWDQVVGRDDLFRFDQTSLDPGQDFGDFANEGIGTGTGVEVFGRWADDRRLLWASLSVARAFRRTRAGTEWRPSEADQPVNVVLIGSQAVTKRSRVGSRARFASGPPMTPVLGGAYLTDTQQWLPISGDPWSDRAKSFFAIDVRFDHDIHLRRADVDLYFELQNITNQRNVEIPAWSEDWSEFRPTYGLPVFPSFGVKVDL